MSLDMFPDAAIEYLMSEHCKNPECGRKIETMAFRGTDFCSVDCRKAMGDDVPSVGTHMFVTTEEKKMIEEYRNGRIRR